MSRPIRRRTVLQAGTAVAAASGVLSARPADAAAPAGAIDLSRPDPASAPKIRWWLPMAGTDPAELAREVDAVADAGIGGVELIAMSVEGVDPAAYGWGSPAWADRVADVLAAASRRGLAVDLTIGPQWPASSPAINADSPAASAELVYGHRVVTAGDTYDGPVPEPDVFDIGGGFGGPREPGRPTLVAVTAARRLPPAAGTPDKRGTANKRGTASRGDAPDKPVLLDPASALDLTSRVNGGALTWTPPGDGDWLLFSFWRRGTGQTVAGAQGTAYVVDHYAAAGTDAVTSYWETRVLTPAVRRLIGRTGGDLFEDSLELRFVLPWTDGLPAEFARRRGYALEPYLPVLLIQHLHAFNGTATPDPSSAADFDFPGDTGWRIRNDFYQVLTELYESGHLDRLRAWAASVGLAYRAQPGYGSVLDMASAATHVDVPETEQLFFGDSVDAYRAMAGAVHLSGARVYSVEAAPVLTAILQDAYGATWPRMLDIINLSFAGGVNQAVFHGLAYATAPGARWPGWAPFAFASGAPGPGFAEAWGPRQPSWRHMPDITGYLAHQQRVLRTGTPRVDLAVYRHSYWDTSGERLFTDPGVRRAGFSYEALPPALLAAGLPTGPGLIAPEGPAYQALVIPAGARPDVPTARAMLRLARRKVPVVIVGPLPDRTPFFDGHGSSDDARVRALMAQLSALPGVRRVDSEAGITDALAALGVAPRVRPADPVDVWSVLRQDGGTTYCWLFNPGAEAVSTQVSIAAAGVPYLLDAWTGTTTALPRYRRGGGRTTLDVQLAASQTVLVAVAEPGVLGPAPTGPPVLTSTAEVVGSGGGAALRAPAPGTYSVTHEGGASRSVPVAEVPAAFEPTGWHLSVEDWRPGPDPTGTTVVRHEIDLPRLLPWPGVPELQDVSGIGVYTASFDLPSRPWTGGRGAYLDLGAFFNTARVELNGHRLPPVDPHHPVLDLAGRLRAGRNTLRVEVTTTLRNRLRTLDASQAVTTRQEYGLLGPVTIRPYGEVRL
jgi:hypothetical protein